MTGARRRRDRNSNAFQKQFAKINGEQVLRGSLMLVLVGILTTLYPTHQGYEFNVFREGTIAPDEVIAPETFYVFKNETDYNREVTEIRNKVPAVLNLDPSTSQESQSALISFVEDLRTFGSITVSDSLLYDMRRSHPEIGPVSESTLLFLLKQSVIDPGSLELLKSTALQFLIIAYQDGIFDNKFNLFQDGPDELIVVLNGTERRVSTSEVAQIGRFTQALESEIGDLLPEDSPIDVKTVFELVVAFLSPDLTYNAEETDKRRNEAVGSVQRIKGTVMKDERIVDAHNRVTLEHIDKLNSLISHMDQRRQEDPEILVMQMGARAILNGLIVAIFFGFLALSKAQIYKRTSNIVLFGLLILMPTSVAHYAADLSTISPFLVPIALSAMLATVLFDFEVGLVISLVSSAICASILNDLQYSLVFLITGIIGAYSVRKVLHRRDFYHSMAYLIVAYVVTIFVTGVLFFNYINTTEFFTKVKSDLVYGVFAACASSVLTIGLLPIFESVFKVITSITLLELSDLNRPLLRNLAIRAPGTYSHSMTMASLAEAAADAISGNRLLARVGCYYHDIGKMIRPHYFTENQKSINPHDELQPKMSALILISHVKEGVELAEEEGLPQALIDLIPQHHGTSEIASFKHRALERGDKQTVRDEDFRYPGPKPQTKEAGIINLADAVESATRTLPNFTPDHIKGMVQIIVKGRFTAGELDECDLTLRDLTRIQQAFLPILQAIHHHRIPYPWQLQETTTRDRRRETRERA